VPVGRRIESKDDVKITLLASDEPGNCVLYFVVGPSALSDPVEPISVQA